MSCLCEMVKTNYNTLTKFGVSITKNKDLANDLISETYIDIHSRKKQVPCTSEDFCRYFYRYMKLISLKTHHAFYRATHSKETYREFLNDIEDSDQESKEELFTKIEKLKSSLDDLDLTLFELSLEKGYSYREIVYIYNQKYNAKLTVQGIYTLMKPLRQKIKEYKWQD